MSGRMRVWLSQTDSTAPALVKKQNKTWSQQLNKFNEAPWAKQKIEDFSSS